MRGKFFSKNEVRLLGKRGVFWFGVSLVSSLLLAVMENGIAVSMLLLLSVMGFVGGSELPAWLPDTLRTASPMFVWAMLVVISILRCAGILGYQQSGHVLLELVRFHMRLVMGYALLKASDPMPAALSRVQFHMGHIQPRVADRIFHLTQLVSWALQISVLCLGMFYLAWRETIVGLVCVALLGLTISWTHRVLGRMAERVPEHQATLDRTLVRIVRNWFFIRVLGIHEKEYRNYLASVGGYHTASIWASFLGNVSSVLPIFGGVLALAVILFINLRFGTPGPDLVAFLYLFVRFVQQLASAVGRLSLVRMYKPHWDEAERLIFSLSPQEVNEALSPSRMMLRYAGTVAISDHIPGPTLSPRSDRCAIQTGPPTIHVQDITFTWPRAHRPVFEGLSLRVAAGSHLAIVGPNGSGKSTLLANILGIVKPSAGTIKIDGLPSADYVRSNYECISYVGAEANLFQGSIQDNLSYGGAIEVSESDVWDKLQLVGLDEFVRRLPGGLSYKLMEEGDGLSSGQKQRLAIARALLREPSLLVLDEAASSLDAASEATIASALQALQGRCTVISVSHKARFIQGADSTVDMGALACREGGRLVTSEGDLEPGKRKEG